MKCGEFGHLSKAGTPCGFDIPETDTACHNHAEDKTRQQAITSAGGKGFAEKLMPDKIRHNGYRTLEDCLQVSAQVTDQAAKGKHRGQLEVILRAGTLAKGVHETYELKRANDLMEQMLGNGANVLVLNDLLQAKTTPLVGRKKKGAAGPELKAATA